MEQPSKLEIIIKLNGILDRTISRDEIVNWAMEYIECDDLEVVNLENWKLLVAIGGLDLIEKPNVYLYSDDDIREWIRELLLVE